MNSFKIVGIILITAGVLGLVYGKFSYTKVTKMGPTELSIQEQQSVNIPFMVGTSAVIMGGLILLFGVKRG